MFAAARQFDRKLTHNAFSFEGIVKTEEDVGHLIVWVLREYEEIDPIILSVGEEEELSIKDSEDLIAKALDFTGKIQFDTTMSDGQMKKTASNTKLKCYRPNFTFTPLNEAIKMTCNWFVANYDIART
ncbi:hypothetical protein CgunFtcFv8_008748 [Champsocephalus gunnari]|uniref:Uncharacterized protein n=1 Tax=Champsocephalus gunnari TaxID=52237 RepID=A0AAN8D0V7_CHAGU|nr:hypothetical protein CgunFtcFv8_008748 [Champsocephalus gunnari]